MTKREVMEITEPEVKEIEISNNESKDTVEKKKRGRPKKEKEEKPKKPIGRPKSQTDIKTRRLLYGLTFFSKMLGLTDEEIEKKKDELLANIKSGKINTNEYQHLSDGELPEAKGKDSEKNITV